MGYEQHGDLQRVDGRPHATPEYTVWKNMRRRCTDPTHRQYHHYGGRGITVCVYWLRSYSAFLADVGRRPPGPIRFTIERVDNSRGYEPDNVVWAPYHEQLLNRRPHVHTQAPYWMRHTWGARHNRQEEYICVFPKNLPTDWRG